MLARSELIPSRLPLLLAAYAAQVEGICGRTSGEETIFGEDGHGVDNQY